ncbi:MAG TPA: DUF2141 domain-containing protein [Geminicoccaceae bacterium]|nr:DUF2141 domain-containing protein [Geminicoccaceae bacterium]
MRTPFLPLLPCALVAAALPAAAATLVVRAEGIGSTEGELKVAVCDQGFDESGCRLGSSRAPTAAVEEFTFHDLAPGRYAVAVYHDVNGNGRLDTVPLGLPTEPYGFSNDVGRFRPPSFTAALVGVGEGSTTVVVDVRPLLGRR